MKLFIAMKEKWEKLRWVSLAREREGRAIQRGWEEG